MSTPNPPDERPGEQPAEEPVEQPVEADAAATEQYPAADDASAGQPRYVRPNFPPNYPSPFPPGYAGTPPGPFAPRVREPWVNPAKRAPLLALAIVLALVLLGGGVAIGAAVGHDHNGGFSRQVGPFGTHQGRPFGGNRVGVPQPGLDRRPGFAPRRLPGANNGSSSAGSSTAPTPAPSSSHR